MISTTLAAICLGLFISSLLIQIGKFIETVYHKRVFHTRYFYIPAIFLMAFYLFSHL